jgi:hypothetical protein
MNVQTACNLNTPYEHYDKAKIKVTKVFTFQKRIGILKCLIYGAQKCSNFESVKLAKLNLNRRGTVENENNSFQLLVGKCITYPTGWPKICARKIYVLNCGRNVREGKCFHLTILTQKVSKPLIK